MSNFSDTPALLRRRARARPLLSPLNGVFAPLRDPVRFRVVTNDGRINRWTLASHRCTCVHTMRKEYDFSKGKRGPVIPLPPGKTRITIRIDDDILNFFRDKVNRAGGGNYQTMMNNILREFMMSERQPLEDSLRRVVREELAAYRRNSSTQGRGRSSARTRGAGPTPPSGAGRADRGARRPSG